MIPQSLRPPARTARRRLTSIAQKVITVAQLFIQTPLLLLKNRFKDVRNLEIGPGQERLEGFETLNIVGGRNVDYVWNAARRLPFRTGSFDLLYASHVLEHIPWYRTQEVLTEWIRVLKPGGRIELWVPDGVKICEAFVAAEKEGKTQFHSDGWYRFNSERDPCLWASGRVFSYGDGLGTPGHPNWHLALFSFRYLETALRKAGCASIERLGKDAVRGYDHGWINLGIAGTKQ